MNSRSASGGVPIVIRFSKGRRGVRFAELTINPQRYCTVIRAGYNAASRNG